MTQSRLRALVTVAVVAAAILVFVGLSVLSRRTPPQIGLRNGTLRPCPDKPNCVSSLAKRDRQRVEPLRVSDTEVALDRLREIVGNLSNANIVSADANYLHAEFRSPLFRFVDDVEFLLDVEAGVVHVRSASRVGYSDLGANRARVEMIRIQFQ